MSETAARGLSRRKKIAAVMAAFLGVLYSAYGRYQQTGQLNWRFWVLGAVTVCMVLGIVAFVDWWDRKRK